MVTGVEGLEDEEHSCHNRRLLPVAFPGTAALERRQGRCCLLSEADSPSCELRRRPQGRSSTATFTAPCAPALRERPR